MNSRKIAPVNAKGMVNINDKGIYKGFKLRCHNHVNQHDRQNDYQTQRGECIIHHFIGTT